MTSPLFSAGVLAIALASGLGTAHLLVRQLHDHEDHKGEDHEVDDLGDEMADVLWVLLCLANQTGINLEEAFQINLEKKTLRDKDRHHQNPKLK